MKLQYKIALMIMLLGIIIITIITLGFDIFSHKTITQTVRINKKILVEEVALHMESHIEEKIITSRIISAAPSIKKALKKSNEYYSSLTEEKQKEEIDSLNNKWKNTNNIDDPFIQSHMVNPVAQYFNIQQELQPGEFGEIFLTNKYGVMIATTGKLTTLAHSHKYWWRASYNNGKGKVFIDDRGFDTSVKGYVLGIVVPIKENGEIIGILKSNIKISGSLTNLTDDFQKRDIGKMQVVRTNGDIVAEYKVAPLSTKVNEDIVPLLKLRKSITLILKDGYIMATAPINITLGEGEYGFGGSKKSIDHLKGSRGNAWHIVLSVNTEENINSSHQKIQIIALLLCFLVLFTAGIAMLYGKLIAGPLLKLAQDVKDVGNGNFNKKVDVLSKDEIGVLAKSLNEMIDKLNASKEEFGK